MIFPWDARIGSIVWYLQNFDAELPIEPIVSLTVFKMERTGSPSDSRVQPSLAFELKKVARVFFSVI